MFHRFVDPEPTARHVGYFTNGACMYFATALARHFGSGRLYVVSPSEEMDGWDHVMWRRDDGRYVDITGIYDGDGLRESRWAVESTWPVTAEDIEEWEWDDEDAIELATDIIMANPDQYLKHAPPQLELLCAADTA